MKFNSKLFYSLLIFFVPLVLFAQEPQKVDGPLMQVSETVFDFGNVPTDTVVSHIFVLKNVGSDSLRIQRIKSG